MVMTQSLSLAAIVNLQILTQNNLIVEALSPTSTQSTESNTKENRRAS